MTLATAHATAVEPTSLARVKSPRQSSRQSPRRPRKSDPPRRGRKPGNYPEIDRTEIAKEVGCSIAMVSAALSGKRSPSLSLGLKLAEATGISMEDLNSLSHPQDADKDATNGDHNSTE